MTDHNTAKRYADRRSYPIFVFNVPDVLATGNDDLIPALFGQGKPLTNLLAFVKTAPVGADLIIGFHKVALDTGVVASAFATLTIPDGAFSASKDLTPVSFETTEGLAITIDQVGSGTPGANLTAQAR